MGITEDSLARALDHLTERIEATEINLNDIQLVYERILRRRAENRLRASTARFEALLDAMPQAVLVADGKTGIIKRANAQAAELFGYSAETLVGLSVEELVPERYRNIHPAYRIGFLASIRKREMGYHPPIYGQRRDGSNLEMAIALTASAYDDDVMVICSDYEMWTVPEKQEASEPNHSS